MNASLGHAENALLRKSMLQITVNIKRNSVLIKHLFFTPLYGMSYKSYFVILNIKLIKRKIIGTFRLNCRHIPIGVDVILAHSLLAAHTDFD